MVRRYVSQVVVVALLGLAAALVPAQVVGNADASVGVGHRDDRSGGSDGYGPPPGAAPQEAWAWTQLVSIQSTTRTEVRYVTPARTCPSLRTTVGMSTTVTRMTRRSTVGQYPTTATVCTATVPPAATAAQIDTTTTGGIRVRPNANGTVPLPNWTQPGATARRPTTIAVIGDTGCRATTMAPVQDCNAIGSWPFPRLASNAASQPVRPDLVIHTGDYIYRSAIQQAPGQAPLCGASGTSGDPHTWGCLVTDFFRPAQELLAASPFVFVRGNHETCGRAGAVWFRYLANGLSTTACNTSAGDYTPPVRIDAGSLGLLLFDSSCSSDDTPNPSCDRAAGPARYQAQFNRVNTLAEQGTDDKFLLSHSPLWTINGVIGNDPTWIDRTLEAALANSAAGMLSQRIRLVLSGHVHLYQTLDFGTTMPPRPPQVTVGSSGTLLDQQTWQDSALIGKTVDNRPIGHLLTVDQLGYGVLRDLGQTWNLRYFNQFGTVVTGTNCTLVGAQFPSCS